MVQKRDEKDLEEYSISKDAKRMLKRAWIEDVETVWDRLERQEPQCGYCALGISCRICAMGPCRIDPFGEGPQKGVCGANADVMVARNLARTIAAGASAHSDHGRDILETFYHTGAGETEGYDISDVDKLERLAQEYGIETGDRNPDEIAEDLGWEMMEDFGTRREQLTLANRVPESRLKVWEDAGITPRGIDRENVETLHRTHMGVDNHYVNILLHALRTSLSDGWGGSMIATELSDILFGTPKPTESKANLGVIDPDQVNIALHGHNPMLSDVIVRASQDEELQKLAEEKGAEGINLVGLCCTGNELQMRRGIPMAGNHLMQELAIMTGALDAMLVDYQCIMPGVVDVAKCFNTEVITTFDKAKFHGATHISFDPERGMQIGRKIVRKAIENYENRVPERILIPDDPVDMMAGFSVEAILEALGGTPEPLVEAIKDGKIRGAVGVVGCNNPKIKHDYGHVKLTRRLIENDILVVVTGCSAVANGKAGHMTPEGAKLAGPALGEVCESLGIPPVLHMGSCVDNTRILNLAAALADFLETDISDLPLAGAAPEWYSEKAVSIGTYVVASGIYTVLGTYPAIYGSPNVVELLADGLEKTVGATFDIEPDPERAAVLIRRHIEKKREKLGLPFNRPENISMPEPEST
ncbi:carbon monoxide dehydrogenase [candidate division MSBL1 archaeon SCGC-AAA259E22]|uniref:Carbon monoxide dehydrogenase n=1 Tax=candidate division MSBL1 archaeon SCGC-AAA259E22 TaxID=1698265 RepID=A0A133UH89_9EURY|nr:carbon monoxide dehydrogenase [candidate division MSBL1 archaeon SCGC-AAA259E22]